MSAPTTPTTLNVKGYESNTEAMSRRAACVTNCGRSWTCRNVASTIGKALLVISMVGIALSVLHMTGVASLNIGAATVSSTALNSAMFYTLIGSAAYAGLYAVYQTVSHCQTPSNRTTELTSDDIVTRVNEFQRSNGTRVFANDQALIDGIRNLSDGNLKTDIYNAAAPAS